MNLADYPIDYMSVPHTRMVPAPLLHVGMSIVVHGSLIVPITDIVRCSDQTISITYLLPTKRSEEKTVAVDSTIETVVLSDYEQTITALNGELWIDRSKYHPG